MNEFNQEVDQFGASENTVSNKGLILKTLLGVIIAFTVGISNLMQGHLFLSFLYESSGFSHLFLAIAITVILGFVWSALYRTLSTDHGPVFNLITYVVTSAFAGLFLGNSLIIATIIIGSYMSNLDINAVFSALQITTGATFIAVVGGVIALPKLKMEGKAIKFFHNTSILLFALTFAGGMMYIVGYFLHLIGLDFILNLYYQFVYGLGPISLVFSLVTIVFAEFLFLLTLARSKYAVGREPKHMEYFYSIVLVNAIIRIYVEIFKFVLKIIARNSDD